MFSLSLLLSRRVADSGRAKCSPFGIKCSLTRDLEFTFSVAFLHLYLLKSKQELRKLIKFGVLAAVGLRLAAIFRYYQLTHACHQPPSNLCLCHHNYKSCIITTQNKLNPVLLLQPTVTAQPLVL